MRSDPPSQSRSAAARPSQLTLVERSSVARLALERARTRAAARALGSPFLRWRYGAPVADELAIVPQDLRAADPSFASELEFGHFGLAGSVAVIGKSSPFTLEPPSEWWARELHGFAWLRNLRAARNSTARDFALGFVEDWIRMRMHRHPIAREPAVMGRRLISWLTNADLLLEGVSQKTYTRTTNSLGDQLIQLAAHWRHAPDGVPRLIALIALVLGELCVLGHERHLAESERLLAAELDRQILPDGGHVSRNPAALVELLLDILPLRQCYVARQRQVPPLIDGAIGRMMPMLRFMRLGDWGLARFNGVGAKEIDSVVTVLSYDPNPSRQLEAAPHTRYARLARGDVIVLMDIGSPPPLPLAGQAHAGALSFELSAGAHPVLVNGGTPGPADESWRPSSRATASHNALAIEGCSSSRLLRDARLERLILAAPISGPRTVSAELKLDGDDVIVEGWHDGYVERFGLVHSRRLRLSSDGRRLDGFDRLSPRSGDLMPPSDRLFAVHFHVHPNVQIHVASERDKADLRLVSGETWVFRASGAPISLEESIYFSDIAGPRDARQLVLRGSVRGTVEVNWRLERA